MSQPLFLNCPECRGTGRRDPFSAASCSECAGRGVVPSGLDLERVEALLGIGCDPANPKCDVATMFEIVERLDIWGEMLAEREASPLILIGLARDGSERCICTCEGVSEADVRQALADTLIELRTRPVHHYTREK